jgi:hypothetical protein
LPLASVPWFVVGAGCCGAAAAQHNSANARIVRIAGPILSNSIQKAERELNKTSERE